MSAIHFQGDENMKLRKILSATLATLIAISLCSCGDNRSDNMSVKTKSYTLDETNAKIIGRTTCDGDTLWLVQSASAAEFEVNASSLTVTMVGDSSANGENTSNARFAIYVDGERIIDDCMTQSEQTYEVFSYDEARNVVVKIIKLSESAQSIVGVKAVTMTATGKPTPTEDKSIKIEFIGDSITCAYGVDDEDRNHSFSTHTEDATKGYAYKTAELLNADYSLVCYSGHGIISAYTGDGTINTSGLVPGIYTQIGKTWGSVIPDVNKLSWDFSKFQPDYIVLNLGTNDASYVKGDTTKGEAFKAEYIEFLKLIRKNSPDAHIICALGVMGADLYKYVEAAASDYTSQTGDANISCIKLNQIDSADGYAADWHPVEATHTKAAAQLAEYIRKLEN